MPHHLFHALLAVPPLLQRGDGGTGERPARARRVLQHGFQRQCVGLQQLHGFAELALLGEFLGVHGGTDGGRIDTLEALQVCGERLGIGAWRLESLRRRRGRGRCRSLLLDRRQKRTPPGKQLVAHQQCPAPQTVAQARALLPKVWQQQPHDRQADQEADDVRQDPTHTRCRRPSRLSEFPLAVSTHPRRLAPARLAPRPAPH